MFTKPRFHQVIGFVLAALLTLAAQTVDSMLRVEGESLSGHKVVLPEAAKGKVAVLIFGFTRASKAPTSEWVKKLSADFGTRAGFELYQLPVLEDVPRLFRGMAISGMKKGTPENMRDHFVPLLQGEAELKRLVGYREVDDAYVLLLDRGGNIIRQTHGAFTDQNYLALQTAIGSLFDGK